MQTCAFRIVVLLAAAAAGHGQSHQLRPAAARAELRNWVESIRVHGSASRCCSCHLSIPVVQNKVRDNVCHLSSAQWNHAAFYQLAVVWRGCDYGGRCIVAWPFRISPPVGHGGGELDKSSTCRLL